MDINSIQHELRLKCLGKSWKICSEWSQVYGTKTITSQSEFPGWIWGVSDDGHVPQERRNEADFTLHILIYHFLRCGLNHSVSHGFYLIVTSLHSLMQRKLEPSMSRPCPFSETLRFVPRKIPESLFQHKGRKHPGIALRKARSLL